MKTLPRRCKESLLCFGEQKYKKGVKHTPLGSAGLKNYELCLLSTFNLVSCGKCNKEYFPC